MKKILSLMLLAIAASVSAMIYAGTPVRPSELPKAVSSFLTKHFPGDEVRKAEKEQGRRGMEYEVDLKSGAEIDFRENGEWKGVKAARGNSVPTVLIPTAISKYVANNHRGLRIVEISRKRGGYEIGLSNGTELKLTEDAKPMTGRKGSHRGNH